MTKCSAATNAGSHTNNELHTLNTSGSSNSSVIPSQVWGKTTHFFIKTLLGCMCESHTSEPNLFCHFNIAVIRWATANHGNCPTNQQVQGWDKVSDFFAQSSKSRIQSLFSLQKTYSAHKHISYYTAQHSGFWQKIHLLFHVSKSEVCRWRRSLQQQNDFPMATKKAWIRTVPEAKSWPNPCKPSSIWVSVNSPFFLSL